MIPFTYKKVLDVLNDKNKKLLKQPVPDIINIKIINGYNILFNILKSNAKNNATINIKICVNDISVIKIEKLNIFAKNIDEITNTAIGIQ